MQGRGGVRVRLERWGRRSRGEYGERKWERRRRRMKGRSRAHRCLFCRLGGQSSSIGAGEVGGVTLRLYRESKWGEVAVILLSMDGPLYVSNMAYTIENLKPDI